MDKKFYDKHFKELSQEDRAELLLLAYKRYAIVNPEPIMDFDEVGKYQSMTERYDVIYKCKCCGETIFMDNFCSKCGQRLR